MQELNRRFALPLKEYYERHIMEENEAYQKLESFNLTGVFWSMVRQITGYDEKDAKSLSRLLLYLFVTAASRVLPNRAFKEIETLKGDGFETYALYRKLLPHG